MVHGLFDEARGDGMMEFILEMMKTILISAVYGMGLTIGVLIVLKIFEGK